MTKKFDELLESLLLEAPPAYIEGNFDSVKQDILSKIPPGVSKGHLRPLQLLSELDRARAVEAMLKNGFTETPDKKFLVAQAENPEELHNVIQNAVKQACLTTPLKATAKYASKFIADRMMTIFKSKVVYKDENGNVIEKPNTQKQDRKNINAYLTKLDIRQALDTAIDELEKDLAEQAEGKDSSKEPSSETSEDPKAAEAAELDLPEVQEKIYDILLSRKDSGKGPMRAIDLMSAIKIPFDQRDRAQAFVNSQLIELKNKGLIKSVGGGQWEAIEKTESGAVLDELGDENFEDVVNQAYRKLEMDADPYGKRNVMKRDIARGYEGRDFEDI